MAYQVTAKSLHTKFWGVGTENKLTHVNYRCINISGHPQTHNDFWKGLAHDSVPLWHHKSTSNNATEWSSFMSNYSLCVSWGNKKMQDWDPGGHTGLLKLPVMSQWHLQLKLDSDRLIARPISKRKKSADTGRTPCALLQITVYIYAQLLTTLRPPNKVFASSQGLLVLQYRWSFLQYNWQLAILASGSWWLCSM